MKNKLLETIDKNNLKENVTPFKIGDSVKVMVRIKEGDKARQQAFAGIVIGRKGSGSTETFTVRRSSFGEMVERVFPLHSPIIASIEVETSHRVRRAKLYYLRKKSGKSARLKQIRK